MKGFLIITGAVLIALLVNDYLIAWWITQTLNHVESSVNL